MSNRSADRYEKRAEARRRSRLAARGESPEAEETEATEKAPARSGGFLTRIFPPAPPLPDRPDPLAGYTGSGPLRPITERIYLLTRHPLPWVLGGVVAFIGYMASAAYRTSLIGLLGTFVLFGALIAAGWYGWQRPTLFGTAAGLLGFFVLTLAVTFAFAQQGVGPETFGSQVGQLLFQGMYQAGLGFLGGWYGGYLRRRQAQVSSDARRRR
ncbi:MAG: hypothetical protein ACRDGD_10115 [Candidatus Limnocylindria bacterium]